MALDPKDPTTDLTRHTHGDDLPEDTTVTVLRNGPEELPIHIPKLTSPKARFGKHIAAVRTFAGSHLIAATAVRGALLIALLLVLLRADGQSAASIGLARAGLSSELLAGFVMIFATITLQIVLAIPLALGLLEKEGARRTAALGTLANQGSILEFALAAIVAAAFEEIAFRGFLTPRLRALVGSWVWAALLMSIVFGLGHIYEGPLAVLQTACLGAWFAGLMLLRRRLEGPIVAHAAFNTIMLILVRVASSSHLIEKLQSLKPH
jgi:membrane protease YdiL (CAAX protease family)